MISGPVAAIIGAKLRIAAHQVASVRGESKLKVGVISISALLLWIGAFVLFKEGFDWLIDFGGRAGGEFNFGDLLMARMLGILGITLFFMLAFSNVLVAFATIYRAKEVYYLLQAPISFEQFFYARFFECVVFSSWSLAFLGSPLFLAYGLSTKASPLFYLAAVVFFVPFITVPAAIGAGVAMALVRVFPRLRARTMILFGVMAIALLFIYIRDTIRGTRVEEDAILPAFLTASARTQSPFLPSAWAAEGVLAASRISLGETAVAVKTLFGAIAGMFGVTAPPEQGWYSVIMHWNALLNSPAGTATYNFLLLLSTALMSVYVAGLLSRVLFYPGWSYLLGQDRQRIRPEGRGPLARIEPLLRLVRNPERALLMKDIKLFWRDPVQWSQFVIFFGIMAIYIANLRNTSRYYEQEFWRSWIACLNAGAVSLILATLTSRFVFPLVSLEGRRFWILGLAPLTYRQLVWQKFFLSVLSTSLFTVPLALLSGHMLQLEPAYYALTVYSIAVTNFGLAGLAVGLGTLYPTFTEDNPARIVSGMGGTLNLLVSIAYITLMVAAQVLVMQWQALGLFRSAAFFWYAYSAAAIGITLLSVAAVFVPMRFGLRHLNNMEF